FQRQRESRALRLAGQRHRNHRARALVENVVAHDEHRALTGLLVSFRRIEIGPKNIPSQYLGHTEISVASPSSAIACSDLLSRLAHSRASAPLSMRLIFSNTAS